MRLLVAYLGTWGKWIGETLVYIQGWLKYVLKSLVTVSADLTFDIKMTKFIETPFK